MNGKFDWLQKIPFPKRSTKTFNIFQFTFLFRFRFSLSKKGPVFSAGLCVGAGDNAHAQKATPGKRKEEI